MTFLILSYMYLSPLNVLCAVRCVHDSDFHLSRLAISLSFTNTAMRFLLSGYSFLIYCCEAFLLRCWRIQALCISSRCFANQWETC